MKAPAYDSIEMQSAARRLWDRFGGHNVGAMVEYILKQSMESGSHEAPFTIDDLSNLYPDPSDWTAQQCRDWIDENGGDYPDDSDPEELDRDDIDYESELDAWREVVRDNAEPAEPLEWWAVHDHLAEQLDAMGEPILDAGYCKVWGRTTTGQAVWLDSVIQEIARAMIERGASWLLAD